ncbi:hypothetical protein CYMTET_50612 [Cymbomonas tetramitiformis]|uniref:Thiolase N-terminal domain-containing protein n=1 Tax=Cymbomonas tetramitiformis TaxID=36881 RepID=A0AAE0BMX1_9CHLO|nr:hypothetical protein CYMTET_50612 [Cymbomonas tetramitiformis]
MPGSPLRTDDLRGQNDVLKSAKSRLENLSNHLPPPLKPCVVSGVVEQSVCSAQHSNGGVLPEDVVIVSALRTPITKAKRGGLRNVPAHALLTTVLQATLKNSGVPAQDISDVVVGTALGDSQRAAQCRIAMFLAGFPESVPGRTCNRMCSSGLQAVADVAASIKAGYYDIGLACGVESMSSDPFITDSPVEPEKLVESSSAQSCLLPMGLTSENVADTYGISRKAQDELALTSHTRAARAMRSGRFAAEIVPVATKEKNPSNGEDLEFGMCIVLKTMLLQAPSLA